MKIRFFFARFLYIQEDNGCLSGGLVAAYDDYLAD